ncbi:4-coumarate-CoA ligase-like protein [Corynespora cassiicola Philippines]|uniref:4-coumarate-CoA ligase-like protein n=1 Tax=Corynespora cassiicola Philippines TaxID=1448308 RepID=A0A2T2NW58_CORCC|nr:4-coumarate-CoA ligase-like protein [Corynespora cassiicola Philippines]
MPFLAEEHIDIPNKDILSWIFDDQKYDQDKPIYIDATNPTRTISSRQARSTIRKLCAGFQAEGLEDGDCVCVVSFNDIYYPLAFLGILSFGGIFAGSNPSHTPGELSHALRTAACRALLVEPAVLPTALKAAKEVGIPRSRVFVFDHETPLSQAWDEREVWGEGLGGEERWGGCRSWRVLMGRGEGAWVGWDDAEKNRTRVAARLFSSGTTGLPKAVEMTHGNFVAQHMMVLEWKARDYEVRRLLCTPMFHVSNVPRAHTSPLRLGSPTYILPRFSLHPWLTSIPRFSITEINLVPPMVLQVLHAPRHLTAPPTFASVKFAWVGAAPLAPEQQAAFKALLPPSTPFNQVWGMSETSCIATMVHWPEHDPSGSVGRFLPDMDAKLVDDAGTDISGFDVPGELCVRGPLVVKGYFANDEANRASWDAEGYFHTGDVAVRREGNGLWYIVDRKKELIKVRGFQVAPAEVEGVVLEMPGVEDVAVVGVADRERGSERPRAYVVRKREEGVRVGEEDVQRWVGERLAGYKQLTGGVRFVEAIPKNASGKILKKELRALERVEGAKL